MSTRSEHAGWGTGYTLQQPPLQHVYTPSGLTVSTRALHCGHTEGAGGKVDNARSSAAMLCVIAVQEGATRSDGCMVERGRLRARQGRVPVPHSTATITLGGCPRGVAGMGPGLTRQGAARWPLPEDLPSVLGTPIPGGGKGPVRGACMAAGRAGHLVAPLGNASHTTEYG